MGEDKHGNLHCERCGAFVESDHETISKHYHYFCENCMSTGYIKKER